VDDLTRLLLTPIEQLMSYGVHTLDASARIADVIPTLRRIGHEGYPVVEGNKLVGLLTRRDADRATEHNLNDLRVRDIMQRGNLALTPTSTVAALEQQMVASGWGQIPIMDAEQQLIGIVTRTDLIRFWAKAHQPNIASARTLHPAAISAVLGKDIAHLIDAVAGISRQQNAAVYLVGGCVRDLLLQRANFDIDFVVEGDAIAFANAIQMALAGKITSFRPFGTAKWTPNSSTAHRLNIEQLPDHIDFASARNEYYLHPTALPTVYQGSIKLDLQRRDFTINTLALQVSPEFGHILNFFGGIEDLEHKRLRVLHPLSFIDDPTRILRAVRFEQRLDFTLEADTLALIATALPMLGRITGERIRNELNLLLEETTPQAGWLRLDALGVLQAIHPDLHFAYAQAALFEAAQQSANTASQTPFVELGWHLLMCNLSPEIVESICERLLFPRTLQQHLIQTAQLGQQLHRIAEPEQRRSERVRLLDGYNRASIEAHLIASRDTLVQQRLLAYLQADQLVKPIIDGDYLKQSGLKPGPCFKRILDRLRDALLDQEIEALAGEKAILQQLLAEGICDDPLR
jgi:tRNA nucleotidyltransferase (CCA-adding enzyme)